MKKIKSKRYIQLEKTSQFGRFNGLPGDPSLPPGVTNRMIEENAGGFDDGPRTGKGQSSVNVNWAEFGKWYLTGGESLPPPFGHYGDSSIVNIDYEYEYEPSSEQISKIISTHASEQRNRQEIPIASLSVREAILEYYSDSIEQDIRDEEGESELNNGPDSNAFVQ